METAESSAADMMDVDSGLEQQIDNVMKIEHEFAALKERIFKDQLSAVAQEVQSIKSGKNADFLEECLDLEKRREEKIKHSEMWFQLQQQAARIAFEQEVQAHNQQYEAECRAIRHRMLQALSDKMKVAKEEHASVMLEKPTQPHPKKKGKVHDGRQTRLNPPHIICSLKDQEIAEDLEMIQKSVANIPFHSFNHLLPASTGSDGRRWCRVHKRADS